MVATNPYNYMLRTSTWRGVMASIQKYPDEHSGPCWRVQVCKRGHTISKILETRKAADDWARKAEAANLDDDVDRQIEQQAQKKVTEILAWYGSAAFFL